MTCWVPRRRSCSAPSSWNRQDGGPDYGDDPARVPPASCLKKRPWRKDADEANDPPEYVDGSRRHHPVTAVGALFALFGTERASRILQEVCSQLGQGSRPGNIRLREGDNKVLKPVDWTRTSRRTASIRLIQPARTYREACGANDDNDREAGWG